MPFDKPDRVLRAVREADERADRAAYVGRDPVSIVRERPAGDREAAALLVAAIALGRAASIRRSARDLLDRLTGPNGRLALGDCQAIRRRLRGFRHRFFAGPAVAALACRIGAAQRTHGSLEALFVANLRGDSERGAFRSACAAFVRALDPDAAVLPDPRRGSACKRLHLFLRWVVRPDDGVDLGLWNLPASLLILPVDVHVHRIALDLGLTRLRTSSWKAAEEITAALRRIDPADPARFDLALAHIGITRGCSAGRCSLGRSCDLWRVCARGRAAAPERASRSGPRLGPRAASPACVGSNGRIGEGIPSVDGSHRSAGRGSRGPGRSRRWASARSVERN